MLVPATETHGQELDGNSDLSKTPILDTRMESWPVDVAMTREQERALWERLCQPYTPSVINVALDDWVDSVESICPIAINVPALEANGLRPNTKITLRVDTPPSSLLVHAMLVMEQLDCVLEIRQGVVRITTEEFANDNLAVRIYDVSSLTVAPDARQQIMAVTALMRTIQNIIEPTQWEVLGGAAVIEFYPANNKRLLCIAAATQVHWQVVAFLDQLQRAGGARPEEVTPPRRVATTTPPRVSSPPTAPGSPSITELPRFRPQ